MRATVLTFLTALLLASAQNPPRQTTPPRQNGAAQNQPAQNAPRGAFKFEATTQLVVVNLSAKDKDGNPIKGLKPTDFTVTEDGKTQTVKVFEYQELEDTAIPAPAPAPAPAPGPKGTPEPKKEAPKPTPAPAALAKALEANVVKPVVATQIAPAKPGEIKYKDRRLLVMFFDLTGMPIQDQMRAQNAAQKFLKTQMTPSDLMAIMTFSNDLRVLEDFTDDRDLLAKDIKGLSIGEGSDIAGAVSDDSAEDTAPPIRPTTRNSTSSIPTANWRRSRQPCACWVLCRKRKRWCTSPAAWPRPAWTTRRNCAPPSMPPCAATWRSIR